MWEVRTQWTKPDFTGNAETCSVYVETRREAEAWWETRTRGAQLNPTVYTMLNPEGKVVRVTMK